MSVNNAYATKMRPYAQKAATALNMPVDAILAQWALESGNGTSEHAQKYNNHAGIKVPTSRKFYGYKRTGTPFAGYASLDAFANDYIENMKLSYYNGVRGQGSVEATIKALGASPWDEGHYTANGVQGGALLNLLGIAPGKQVPPKVCPTCHRPL